MTNFICATCGTQFEELAHPPVRCPICEDERQYIGWGGQSWTSMEALRNAYHNNVRELEPNLFGVGVEPSFAIGQRALLILSEEGNVLWDCVSLLDEPTTLAIQDLGGISAIAISHPHYYSSMIEWSQTFDAPVYLHAADRDWVQRPDPRIQFWQGATHGLAPGITLVHCGGHFDGGTVLHWENGAGGAGALLSGDILQVVSDRRYVSFMYSYPNLIPLPASAVEYIVFAVEPFSFERIYGAWWGRVIAQDAKLAVRRSAERYLRAIGC